MDIQFSEVIIYSLGISGLIFVIWLLVLSWQLVSMLRHYRQLVEKTDRKHLQTILQELLRLQGIHGDKITKIQTELQELQQKQQFSLQQIGFLRFNPFQDTGGDQSFALALLDDHENGIVITSLYTRDRTRLYAKMVTKGTANDIELSEEEKQVIAKARPFRA